MEQMALTDKVSKVGHGVRLRCWMDSVPHAIDIPWDSGAIAEECQGPPFHGSRLRFKVKSSGIRKYVLQCRHCGCELTGEIKHAYVPAIEAKLGPATPFDQEGRRKAGYRRIDRLEGRSMRPDYHQYIQSPEWAAKREQKFAHSGRHCQLCRSTDRLNVHHNTYDRLGREEMSDLVVLCKPCHEKFHGRTFPPGGWHG